MADLVDHVLAHCGLAPEPEPQEPSGPFNRVAERHRLALIDRLEHAKASIEILLALATMRADCDRAFSSQAESLSAALSEAGDEAARFHFARECRGTC